MRSSKKVGSFRAVPVKSIGGGGEEGGGGGRLGAVDFTEIEESLVLVKQKLSALPDFLQKVDEEFEKVGTFRAVPVKSIGDGWGKGL